MGAATSSLGTADLLKAPRSEWPETVRFSTDDLPEADRVPYFQEIVSREVMRLEVDPFPANRFHTSAHMRLLPGLVVYWTASSPRHNHRTRALLSDGNDNVFFQWASTVRKVEHLGRELFVGPGEGIAYTCAEPSSFASPSDYHTISLSVPRNAFGFLLQDADGCLARPLPGQSAAQQLLLAYLGLLREESFTSTPELRESAVHHVYDLLALALGATRDAAEVAKKRGVRAARLAAIKTSIRANLSSASLAQISGEHRLSVRYVQSLFEDAGTTFTQFLLDERLLRARQILASPRSAGRKITDIAYSCGFGDISYFNRKFRARFGASPGEMRNQFTIQGFSS
jgi:AraC-like DNA-binding protein